MSTPESAIIAIAKRQGMRRLDYPTSVDWDPVSGPVRGWQSTVPQAPPERDHIYRAALQQQQRQNASDASG